MHSVAKNPSGNQLSVSQRLIFGPILFNLFINNLDNGTERTFSRFVNSRKIRENGRSICWRAGLFFQKHLNGLKKEADKSLIKFNEGQVLQLEWNRLL